MRPKGRGRGGGSSKLLRDPLSTPSLPLLFKSGVGFLGKAEDSAVGDFDVMSQGRSLSQGDWLLLS